jgi:hypothetical protein
MSRKLQPRTQANVRTPNENDFCRCGGIFLKDGTCVYCKSRKTLGNRYEPGPRDWGSAEVNAYLRDLEQAANEAEEKDE